MEFTSFHTHTVVLIRMTQFIWKVMKLYLKDRVKYNMKSFTYTVLYLKTKGNLIA